MWTFLHVTDSLLNAKCIPGRIIERDNGLDAYFSAKAGNNPSSVFIPLVTRMVKGKHRSGCRPISPQKRETIYAVQSSMLNEELQKNK